MDRKKAAQLLISFQCDYNRSLEETFAQTFAENDTLRLFFINENEAFTDGHNIVVDPASDGLYADTDALTAAEDFLGWKHTVSADPWYALRMITRAQTIHECLHILYTDFPCACVNDPVCDTANKKKTMAMIANIIEDAYIEAAGCSYYDNLEMYLKFGRVSMLFASHPGSGTAAKSFEDGKTGEDPPEQLLPLLAYLDYMATFLLFPMVRQEEPDESIAPYVTDTKQLFTDGSAAPSPAARYAFCGKIFDRIAPLIPEDGKSLDLSPLAAHLGGGKTHSPGASTPSAAAHSGKTQAVSVRLFTELDGKERRGSVMSVQLSETLKAFAAEKKAALEIVTYKGHYEVYTGKDFDCAVLHSKIKINETRPKINLNLKNAYQNIYRKYRININSYNSRFQNLLRAQVPVREENFLFGSGISSVRLGDVKERYWYRRVPGTDIPDLAVLLLIDGSGSMSGSRRDSTMVSAVILHEVLKKQGISHSVAEHRAGGDPEIDVNILVDIDARDEEKLNLMLIDAYGDNRDGLALFWAERYINLKSHCENKLIIVISDGVPAHAADQYYPPVSVKDTANAAAKIIKRGTEIIAIALDNPNSADCYDAIKEIYPYIVACSDLKQLTGQLLALISKRLT